MNAETVSGPTVLTARMAAASAYLFLDDVLRVIDFELIILVFCCVFMLYSVKLCCIMLYIPTQCITSSVEEGISRKGK